MVKNLPAIRKTWVLSLGWEDALEKGKYCIVNGVTKSRIGLSAFHFHKILNSEIILTRIGLQDKKVF